MTERIATTVERDGRGANPLIGAWERQGLVAERQVKVFTQTHFVWVVHDRQSGMAVSVGGGTYRFDGATLTEKYEYSNVPQLIGTELTLAVTFQDGDTWRQAGTASTPGVSLDETYRRVR
jgi:hypothetical protein